MIPREHGASICSSRKKVTTSLLLAFLAGPAWAKQQYPAPQYDSAYVPAPIEKQNNVHDFSLRHVFHRGTYQDPNLHLRYDVPPRPASSSQWFSALDDAQHIQIPVKSRPTPIERLADRRQASIERHLADARLAGQPSVLDVPDWTIDQVPAPDIEDKDTIINLATMAANAYVVDMNDAEWTNVTQGFNESKSFGWEGDGLRGHIFADQNNETIVVSLKGTSPAVFDGDGTTSKDKLNDNLFFSCCCGQGGQYFWRQVCDCSTSTYTCNQTCLVQAIRRENRYYRASMDLYSNITELYPDSNVWLVGHSLGGAVSSLLGMTFGLPVVTFEAPGDDLPAQRLGLPRPPTSDPNGAFRKRYSGSVHVGHTADPIFMGTCNGATAACTLGGYAMESQCHTGLTCIYDTVGDWSWRVGIGNHKIHNVIDNVIRKYPKVPTCVPDDECVDCYNWKYYKSNGSDTTTTTTTTTATSARTRTATCKTPGWWGCLDDSTTASVTSTTSVMTTTYTTTSCVTPGWFGCKEEKNVTITTTTVPPTTSAATTTSDQQLPSSSPSSTCETPGLFGCNDPTPSSTTFHTSASKTRASSTCETPGLFFGCHDRHTSTSMHSITSAPMPSASASTATSTETTTTAEEECKYPVFFGLFCLDNAEDAIEL